METFSRELFKTFTKILGILFECSIASVCLYIKNSMQSCGKIKIRNKNNLIILFQSFGNGFSFESTWTIFISFAVCPEKGTFTYQWVWNVQFLDNLARFVFLSSLFWDLSFCLIDDDLSCSVGNYQEAYLKPSQTSIMRHSFSKTAKKWQQIRELFWSKRLHHRCCDRVLNMFLIT